MNLASIAEREVKLVPVPDTGAEPGGEVKGEGADGPSSTTETKEEEEGGSLMENARSLINTSEATAECTAGGPPSSTEAQEEEGASLLEGVTAPSDSLETAPQCVAGGSSAKSRKRVRLFVSAEEQE